MHAVSTMLSEVLAGSKGVHRTRLDNLCWASSALARGGRLSLTGIGRAPVGSARTKHRIKRADRLLGNKGFHGALPAFFQALGRCLLVGVERAVILVDWTNLNGRFCALAAMLAHDGRAIPLIHSVHDASAYACPDAEKALLDELAKVIPAGCQAVLVTDAGFRKPWFVEAMARGFQVVGRLVPSTYIRSTASPRADTWRKVADVAEEATEAEDLGQRQLTKSASLTIRIVRAGRYRPAKRRKRRGARPKNNAAKKARRMSKLPWLLATNLADDSAENVVGIYAMRMEIEESFRDFKSHRFGWSVRHARPSTAERWRMLLTVAAFATLALHLIGRIGERRGWQYHFQANTVRNHRVLSLFTLGAAIVRARRRYRLRARDLKRELKRLREALADRPKGGEQ